MNNLLEPFRETLPPASLVSAETKVPRQFSKNVFKKKVLAKRKFPSKRVKTIRKKQKVFSNEDFDILSDPIPIPDSNIYALPNNIKKLSSGIPSNVINTYNIPKFVLNNAPKDILESIQKDLPTIETLDKEKLLQLVQSLNLPDYLYSKLTSKFQLISFIYELINEEYYAMWLTKMFKNDTAYDIVEEILQGYKFAVCEIDFSTTSISRIKKKIEEYGGNFDSYIDESVHFIIFKDSQTIDLSSFPHIRPITLNQFNKLIELRLSENDQMFDNVLVNEELQDEDENMDIDVNENKISKQIFIPSKKFQINDNLYTRNGIPLWKYEHEQKIIVANEKDILQLETVILHFLHLLLNHYIYYLFFFKTETWKRFAIGIGSIVVYFSQWRNFTKIFMAKRFNGYCSDYI